MDVRHCVWSRHCVRGGEQDALLSIVAHQPMANGIQYEYWYVVECTVLYSTSSSSQRRLLLRTIQGLLVRGNK